LVRARAAFREHTIEQRTAAAGQSIDLEKRVLGLEAIDEIVGEDAIHRHIPVDRAFFLGAVDQPCLTLGFG
jgi:hypothetical protein